MFGAGGSAERSCTAAYGAREKTCTRRWVSSIHGGFTADEWCPCVHVFVCVCGGGEGGHNTVLTARHTFMVKLACLCLPFCCSFVFLYFYNFVFV